MKCNGKTVIEVNAGDSTDLYAIAVELDGVEYDQDGVNYTGEANIINTDGDVVLTVVLFKTSESPVRQVFALNPTETSQLEPGKYTLAIQIVNLVDFTPALTRELHWILEVKQNLVS